MKEKNYLDQITDLKKQIQENSVQFNDLNKQIQNQSKKISEAQQREKIYNDQITDLYKQIRDQAIKLGESQMKEKDYLDQINNLKKKIQENSVQFNDLNKHIQNQSKKISEAQQREKSYNDQITDLNKQIQANSIQINDLNKHIQNQSNKIRESQEKEMSFHKEIEKLKTQIQSKSKEESFIINESKKENFFIGSDDENFHKTIEQIGRGDISITYKILDTKTNHIMCKKVLSLDKNKSSFEELQKAINEFQILYSLNHPCICKAIGINTSEPIKNEETNEEMTTVALFLEFIDYNLKDCLAKGIINNTLKTRIVVEIAHAMAYLHSLGHIYRDLNIDNIMLNSVYEVKIIDFGLAKINESLFDIETLNSYSMTKGIGSFEFMSPEMLNEEEYDNKTDVYSFGIIMYYMFVGKLPKQNMKEKANLQPIKLLDPSPSISQFCIDLISRCISNDPKDRPSFDAILEELKNNSYSLASEVNAAIVSHRHHDLD